MYPTILAIHNIVRWIVLISGLIAAVKALIGWFGSKEWSNLDDQLGLIFTISLDIQLLLGLVLYIFLSPITTTAFRDFGAAMADGDLRFWAIEHIFMMVLAVILAHIGRALSKKAVEDKAKFKRAAIFYTLAILFILAAIPWDRALLPF